MKIAVIGMGQFGRSLALKLSRAGEEVIAADLNMELVDDVKNDVALAVKLDATDERDLRSQGLHQVDVFVAAIGGGFEANLLAVVLAKSFGIKRVIARAESIVHERILLLIGADEVVRPEEEAAEKVMQRLRRPSLRSFFKLIDGYSVVEMEAPPAMVGRSLAELDLRRRFAVNLIAIKKMEQGKESIDPAPQSSNIFKSGDILALAGSEESLRKLSLEFGGAVRADP